VLRAMIERLDHRVIEAANGKEVVKTALDSNPEVVMMDLSMPEVDGLQATAALRAISNFKDYPETLSVDKVKKRGATRIFENRLIWPIWVPRSEDFCARHKGPHGAAAFLTFLSLLARESGTGQRSCRPSRGVDANCPSVGCRRRR